jgi:hypothetical protein
MRPEDHRDDGEEPRLTRDALAKRLTEAGYPTTVGSLNTWTSQGEGPPVDAWWGRRPMYRWAPALAWAKARIRTRSPSKRSKKTTEPMPNGANA